MKSGGRVSTGTEEVTFSIEKPFLSSKSSHLNASAANSRGPFSAAALATGSFSPLGNLTWAPGAALSTARSLWRSARAALAATPPPSTAAAVRRVPRQTARARSERQRRNSRHATPAHRFAR